MVTEWDHVVDRFEHFIAAINPSPSEDADMRAVVRATAHCLSEHYYGPPTRSGQFDKDYRIVGALAKGTAIAPAERADLLYILPDALRPCAGKKLLDNLVAAAARRYPILDVSPVGAQWGWVLIGGTPDLDDGDRAIRAIPCFDCGGGKGYLTWRTDGARRWRHVNPDAELAELKRADAESGGKATDLVRMLKCWRDAHFVPLSGFALEILVSEFVRIWTYHRRSLLFYDWMVRDFFFWLRYQDARELRIPGTVEVLAIGEGWRAAASLAHDQAVAACRLERESRGGEAGLIWQVVFGHLFPLAPAAAGDALAGPGPVPRLAGPSASDPGAQDGATKDVA
jgi:hypothetical protein